MSSTEIFQAVAEGKLTPREGAKLLAENDGPYVNMWAAFWFGAFVLILGTIALAAWHA